jgi:hypothetical protein
VEEIGFDYHVKRDRKRRTPLRATQCINRLRKALSVAVQCLEYKASLWLEVNIKKENNLKR